MQDTHTHTAHGYAPLTHTVHTQQVSTDNIKTHIGDQRVITGYYAIPNNYTSIGVTIGTLFTGNQ